jgi:hypothetical protein
MTKLDIVSGVQKSNDYPYGRLRCEITFAIEFKKDKGYRFVTQTRNPKTGRLNNPKLSTYAHFMTMYKDENGHIKHHEFNFFGYNDIQKFIEFITVNEISLPRAESTELYAIMIGCIRGNAMYTQLKEDVTINDFFTATKVKEMISLYGAKADINELKNIGYNPNDFKGMII